MEKLKIGFIGCGGIAMDKHLPGMATQRARVELYAFCDIIPERAEEARQKYGCPGAKVFTDYRELLACPEIDAVHVLTPNVKHCAPLWRPVNMLSAKSPWQQPMPMR